MAEPYSHLAKEQRAKAIDAEARCSRWLADGNEATEKGNAVKAEKCFKKAQFWLDRFNKICGRN